MNSIKLLTEMYSAHQWFDHVGVDKHNRYVVYVKYMNENVLSVIAQDIDGKTILVQWSNSKSDYLKEKYGKVYTLNELRPYVPSVNQFMQAKQAIADFTSDEVDLDDLIYELDRLEKICGSKVLQDIFYEIHDGINAVTDKGSQYPDVKKKLSALYDIVGFDVIYEELDG